MAASRLSGRGSGHPLRSRNVNVLPSPGTLVTVIVPPSCSTIALQIGRPRPVPPFWRPSDDSTCWKRSKIASWCETGMPAPAVADAHLDEARLVVRRAP